MIEGFEELTADLSAEELMIVPLFVQSFSTKIGKDKSITSRQIMDGLLKKHSIHINGARIRKIINYIRNGYLVPGLIATSNGYYVSRDIAEVKEYIASLGHREAAIASVRKTMENYLKQLEKR